MQAQFNQVLDTFDVAPLGRPVTTAEMSAIEVYVHSPAISVQYRWLNRKDWKGNLFHLVPKLPAVTPVLQALALQKRMTASTAFFHSLFFTGGDTAVGRTDAKYYTSSILIPGSRNQQLLESHDKMFKDLADYECACFIHASTLLSPFPGTGRHSYDTNPTDLTCVEIIHKSGAEVNTSEGSTTLSVEDMGAASSVETDLSWIFEGTNQRQVEPEVNKA